MTTSEFLTWAQIATPAVLTVGGWMLRNAFARFTDQLTDLKESQIKHAAALKQHAEDDDKEHTALLNQKVDREDWIRETSRIRITMEKLVEGQANLAGRLDVGTRIAAAVESLAKDKEDAAS